MLRSQLYSNSDHEAMRERLERKIELARHKLEEMKGKVRHYQLQKQEILKNNDMRRSLSPAAPYTPIGM